MASARTPLGELTSFQTPITGFDLRRPLRGEGKRERKAGKEMKERNGKTPPTYTKSWFRPPLSVRTNQELEQW